MGADLRVRVTIGQWTLLSSPSGALSYALAVIDTVANGVNMPTAGGRVVTLTGSNFGGLADPFTVTYGIPGRTPNFTAVGCTMTNAHTTVRVDEWGCLCCARVQSKGGVGGSDKKKCSHTACLL